jgi:hypothetical protein
VSIIDRTVTYRGGAVQETKQHETRIYAPLVEHAKEVWVASEAMNVHSLTDPRVQDFATRGTYTGMLRPLKSVANMAALRNPKVGDKGARIRVDIPDSALALVSLGKSAVSLPESYLAPVIGTDRQLWVVAGKVLHAETKLYGRYQPCPSRDCEKFGSFTDPPPAGLLFYEAGLVDRSRINWSSLLFVLGGIVCIVLSRRR